MERRTRMTGEARRERILDAALELFAEKGYAGSTTRELAARAGITEPVIYLHFRSKEEVLRAVFERQSFLPHLRQFAALDTRASLRDQLLDLGRKWRAFMRERQQLVRLVLSEMQHNAEMAQVFRDTLRQGMSLAAQALQAHTDPEEYCPERLEVAVRLFFSSLIAHFLMEGVPFLEESAEVQARVGAMVDLLVDGLRCREEAIDN